MTHQKEVEITGRAVPFDVRRGWVGVSNAIYTVYSKHPDINWTDTAVYAYLLINHNAEFGYAYPSQVKMAVDLGVSLPTIKRSVSSLRKVDLIEVINSAKYNGNQYFFKPICETVEELLAKFPEIAEHLTRLEAQAVAIKAEGELDKARKRKAFRREIIIDTSVGS